MEPRPPLGPCPQLSPHVPTKPQVPPPAGCPPGTPGLARGRLTWYLTFPGCPHRPLGPEHSLPGSVLPVGYLAPCGIVPGAFWGCQLRARTPLLCPSLRHLQACDPDPLCLGLALGKRQPRSLRGAQGQGVGHGRELGCPRRWQEAASLSARSTSDFSSTSADSATGNFKSAPGSLQPQAQSSSEPLQWSHSHQSSLDLLPPDSQTLQRLFPLSAMLCLPLLPQCSPPTPHFPRGQHQAPPGLEAPKIRNQGSTLQPQGPRGLSTESTGSVRGAELLTQ